jgi:hypothetical protein
MTKFIHQKRYADRQKNRKGHIQVKVWVPEDTRDDLIAYAENLRKAKRLVQRPENNSV